MGRAPNAIRRLPTRRQSPGTAWKNRDGSLNLRFNYLPAELANTTIQVREPRPRPVPFAYAKALALDPKADHARKRLTELK
jgi:hypothetical protein